MVSKVVFGTSVMMLKKLFTHLALNKSKHVGSRSTCILA
jgi:hypothetical protein